MMKKFITPLGFITAALLAGACSSDDDLSVKDNSEKTAIEFSMTDNTSAAVAVSGMTRAGFKSGTDIVMRMVAQNASSSSEFKYTKTTATAETEGTDTKLSNVTFSSTNGATTRYWDDAYGRNTLLSVYAVAVPSKTGLSTLKTLAGPSDNSWDQTSSANTINWSVSTDQTTANTKTPIDDEDLVYSNNIQTESTSMKLENGVCNWDFDKSQYKTYTGDSKDALVGGQMKFTLKNSSESTGPGKFDKGNLNFTHALSRVTVNVKLGDGFNTSSDKVDKALLLKMPYTGTLDVQKGTFSSTQTAETITLDKRTALDDYQAQYLGQVLPDYEVSKTSDENVLQFNVGDNIYYVTQAMVYTALVTDANKAKLTTLDETNNKFIMAQGQNYVLNITVSKTKIENITATLADWTDISGAYTRNNAYLTFSFLNTGTSVTSGANAFDIYRAADDYDQYVTDDAYVTANPHYNWATGYSSNGANLAYADNLWKTDWYWDTNKAFYHFRLVGKQTTSGSEASTAVTTDKTNGDYFTIKAGATSQNATWGAPFKSGVTVSYNTTNGFAVNAYDKSNSTSPIISPAIGATNSNINFTMLNMLAHIKVNILTTSGNDKVTLIDGSNATKVYLSKIYTAGTVNMGNGLVKQTGSRTTNNTQMTAPSGDDLKLDGNKIKGSYDYYVVPQSLIDGSTYVGLYIETPDKNVYYVVQKLSEITASTVQNGTNINIGQSKDQKIQYWYPNCCYTYNITLTKTGITNITATLVPYTEISGDTNISIED